MDEAGEITWGVLTYLGMLINKDLAMQIFSGISAFGSGTTAFSDLQVHFRKRFCDLFFSFSDCFERFFFKKLNFCWFR